jgi:hypothetical protein
MNGTSFGTSLPIPGNGVAQGSASAVGRGVLTGPALFPPVSARRVNVGTVRSDTAFDHGLGTIAQEHEEADPSRPWWPQDQPSTQPATDQGGTEADGEWSWLQRACPAGGIVASLSDQAPAFAEQRARLQAVDALIMASEEPMWRPTTWGDDVAALLSAERSEQRVVPMGSSSEGGESTASVPVTASSADRPPVADDSGWTPLGWTWVGACSLVRGLGLRVSQLKRAGRRGSRPPE